MFSFCRGFADCLGSLIYVTGRLAAFTFTFLVIKSLLIQRVQSLTVKVDPSTSVFIFFKLGFHVRLVRFLAWLTLLPVCVRFPQISQVLDIISVLKPKGINLYVPCSLLNRGKNVNTLFPYTRGANIRNTSEITRSKRFRSQSSRLISRETGTVCKKSSFNDCTAFPR